MRESEGVVQLERLVARDHRGARRQQLIHAAQPALDRLEEALLLRLHVVVDGLRLLDQLRDRRRPLREVTMRVSGVSVGSRRPSSQACRTAATENAPHHVALPFVAGIAAVGQEEADRARMIGQHPIGGAAPVLGRTAGPPAAPPASSSGRKRSVWKLESSPCMIAAMRSRPAPVSTEGLGSGVSVPSAERSYCMKTRFQISRKRPPSASSSNSSLPMISGVPPFARLPFEIDVDLGARTARTGVAHLPEVVLVAQTVDAVVGKPGDLAPERPGLGVRMMHRDPQPLRVDPQIPGTGHELPREGDRIALEVVAEREVAQHLEEGVMPCGVAHLLEVVVLAAGPHALLVGGRASVVTMLLSQEGALELHHAGIGEQQRRIVGRDE